MNRLHYFNPGHETAVLNASPFYMPPVNQVRMRRELAYLPAWYADGDDWVWTEDPLPDDFSCMLEQNFGKMPGVIYSGNTSEAFPASVEMEVDLWGITPRAIRFFEEIAGAFGLNLRIPTWNPAYTHLCSRMISRDCLEYLIPLIPEIQPDIVPCFFEDEKLLEASLDRKVRYVVKSPFSSSGRGLLWLPEGECSQSARQILHGMIKKQSTVSVEKALDKKVDFSLQFFSDGRGNISYQGISLFHTNDKGGYEGTHLLSHKKIREYMEHFIDFCVLDTVKQHLGDFLKIHTSSIYRGNIGVDMMIYEDQGNFYLHPCVEINMRTTMGLLALRLQQRFCHDEVPGFFKLDYWKDSRNLYQKHLQMLSDYPLKIENRRVLSGYLPLCPVTESSNYWAFIFLKRE